VHTRAIVFSFAIAFGASCSEQTASDTDEVSQPYEPPRAQREPTVAGRALTPAIAVHERTGPLFEPPAPIWPAASVVEVALPDATALAPGRDSSVAVAGLPVRVDGAAGKEAPRRIKVESFSRAATTAAGVDGVLLRVARSDEAGAPGRARITLDYNDFRWAYGGDWASRLALWVLPECALSAPAAPDCRASKLVSVNDLATGTVNAVVDVGVPADEPADNGIAGDPRTGGSAGGTLVMLSAGSAGPGGDYKATSLSPSATWSAGGNSGDFSWSYPLRVPPSLGPHARAQLLVVECRWPDGLDQQPGIVDR
jgi:hypothetical protein